MKHTHTHNKFFKFFLVLYTGFLLYHAFHMEWTPLTTTAIVLGLVLALISHLRQGYATTILLLIHMAIEWTGHIEHGISYSTSEFVFHGIHSVLDVIFLWSEVKAHLPKYRKVVMGMIISILALASLAIMIDSNKTSAKTYIEEDHNPIESLIIGGILGCTLSHLFGSKKHSEE